MSKTAKKGLLALLLLAVLAAAAAGAYFSYSFFMKQAYPLKYRDIIETQAEKYSIDPAFLYGMIRTESNFNPDAESSAGITLHSCSQLCRRCSRPYADHARHL